MAALWECSATTGRIAVTAELFVERALARRPGRASQAGRLTIDDPCGTQSTTAARAPGATLRFSGGPDADGGERTLAVQHRLKQGVRYWLRITQAGRVGQLRYYVAFRPQAARFAAVWVIAPEAAFEAALPQAAAGGPPGAARVQDVPDPALPALISPAPARACRAARAAPWPPARAATSSSGP
ncbi:MAG TPA: hypothetical protein VK904_02530 [Miltoncostaeaceae bacterium]|nr:hypothetical protein [Miltoncostaeaceae bacterium]